MASIREGGRSALLVVDMQVGVLATAWDVPRTVDRVACAVARARAQGAPVIWVQHANDELVPGSADWQLVAPLAPAAGELLVAKQYGSSFERTELEDLLDERGISHLVLAGAMSNWCIRATAYGALDRGYDLTLVADAHTTADTVLEDGFTIAAEQLVRDLNLVLRWLRYPGRRNGVALADALRFDDGGDGDD